MNHIDKEFIQSLKGLRMAEKTRVRMRDELAAYSELHAISTAAETPFANLSFLSTLFTRSRPLMAGAFAVVVVVSGASSAVAAAEKAVPGDVLYAVKVTINEPAVAIFAGSDEALARYHATLAVRRVAEAEILLARGELTPDVEQDLSIRFEEEATRVVEVAEKLEASGDTSASLAVRTALIEELRARVPADSTSEAAPVAVAMMAKSASFDAAPAQIAIRNLVQSKIALLSASQNRTEAEVISPSAKPVLATVELDESDASSEEDSHSLLSGTSVTVASRAALSSSTPENASTTKPLGTDFLKSLRHSRTAKQAPAPAEDSAPGEAEPIVIPAAVNELQIKSTGILGN